MCEWQIAAWSAVKKSWNQHLTTTTHEILVRIHSCHRTPCVHPSWGIHFVLGGIRGGFRVVFGGIRGSFWGIRALGALKIMDFSTSRPLTFSGRVTLI